MDTTLPGHLGTQLMYEVERTLDDQDLSMSSAIRMFLIRASVAVQEPIDVPMHVHIEVMLEEIAVMGARVHQMEPVEQVPEQRKKLREIGKAVRAMRFQFDPYNEVEVMTMVRKISRYAKAVQAAHQPLHQQTWG